MQKRCVNCFEIFEDFDGMCPYCGYIEGEPAESAYYLQPGTWMNGKKYIMGKVAGQGGFGVVYKAWEPQMERVVAIKEFFPMKMVTRAEGEQQVVIFSSKREHEYGVQLERFRREAQLMADFSKSELPNAIKIYDRFDENGTTYIVMEYIDSPTLKTIMKKRNGTPLPENEVIDYATQMLSILEEMHKQGIYHLDVALDNIFVRTKNGVNELIFYDFGAARSEKHNEKVSEADLIVKPGFAPPEQYKKNGKIGSWTDIYAVGANVYYMLTGVVPMESTDREHEDALEEPAQLEMVSPALNNAVMRAMAINPELRYRSAKEFKEDLKKEKVRSLEEELKHRKKARRRFLGSCAALILLAIAAVGYFAAIKGEIQKCEITVWAVEDSNQERERKRYMEVIDAFGEFYPQITVNLEIMDSTEMETAFFSCDSESRPDLIETTYASNQLLEQCCSLSRLLMENKDVFITESSDMIVSWNEKSIPVGMYVDVIYKESKKDIKSLSEVTIAEFINNATGYTESDTTAYAFVQKNVAGRYEITESDRKTIVFADVFSISAEGINEKKAAKALLAYMLSDSAQETLHITNYSDYLPITENGFNLYVGQVYRELDFLRQSIGEYKPDNRR